MKHYEKLLELGCFSKNDLEQITGSEAAAKWLCREYQKKGYIERVKRDLYVAISLETQQPIASRYVIASHISNDAAVSYHSAFEFYGYSNQVFYETQVTSESRFRDFEYDGVTYRRIAPRITGGITEINGTRVTTLERTVIDREYMSPTMIRQCLYSYYKDFFVIKCQRKIIGVIAVKPAHEAYLNDAVIQLISVPKYLFNRCIKEVISYYRDFPYKKINALRVYLKSQK